jgi:hypothetical protein
MAFEKPGPKNTEITLDTAIRAAKERKISHLVVASTFGETGLLGAKKLKGSGISLVVVSHNMGFKTPGDVEFRPETRKEIEALGGRVLTGTMVLRSLGTALRDKFGGSEQEIVAHTLRMFGQGMKVCVEITAMAADAGLVPPTDIIAVAGTGRGADTAVIVAAQSSNRFFDIKIREVLIKPYGI